MKPVHVSDGCRRLSFTFIQKGPSPSSSACNALGEKRSELTGTQTEMPTTASIPRPVSSVLFNVLLLGSSAQEGPSPCSAVRNLCWREETPRLRVVSLM